MISADGHPQPVAPPLPGVYEDLRRLASSYLSRQPRDHTLEPTALVHEAYLRLIQQGNLARMDRTHCYCVAAKAMRSVLVDHARRKKAVKRGGNGRRVPIDDAVALYETRAYDLVVLDEALTELSALDPQLTQIVEMRFFGGMTEREIGEALGVSERTVRREWKLARMWLFRCLHGGPADDR
ncbi:MAG: sigma-70 family RNA polymerase sigma factor [Phycisphaerales bacterium]|nr:MAG: sigma-70 family RNA polymerase sigma factor [Phycisphaerales bacterium]